MNLQLFKNFFGIRTQVKFADQIILGIIPIFLIFILWTIATTGRKETIKLPEGVFEGYEKTAAPEGTRFTDRIRFTVENCTLDYVQNEDGSQSTFLVKDSERYSISNIPARPFEKSVRLTLPPGKLMAREKIPVEPLLPDKAKTGIVPGETATETRPASPDQSSAGDIPSATEDAAAGEATQPPAAAVDASLPIAANPEEKFTMHFSYRYEVVETRLLAPVILPSPGEVFRSLPSLWSERALPLNILNSFLRVGAGFLVAFIIVFPLALLMGTFSKFKALFAPLVLFGGYLPIPALVPLTMSLFGTSEQQKVMFLALGFAIYLLPLFVKALEEVDNVYLHTGYTLGAKTYQVLNHILLPIALPGIFDAMRLGFGIGWGYIILAEMVDMGSRGVGTLILTSQRRGPREDIYLVLIAIVVMAFITDKIWDIVGKKLFPYRSQER